MSNFVATFIGLLTGGSVSLPAEDAATRAEKVLQWAADGLTFINTAFDADLIAESATRLWLTAAERAKLAGIETAATADLTGTEIVVAIDAELGSTTWRLGSSGINTILNGVIDPTTEGSNGDFYINTTEDTFFGPKTSGSWGTGTPMTGTAGLPVGGSIGQFLRKTGIGNFVAGWDTLTLSDVSDVTVTGEYVSIDLGFRPGQDDEAGPAGVGYIFESVNDGHLYWVHRDTTVHLLCDSGGYGSAIWGSITGTLSNQTDLQAELNGKQNYHATLDAFLTISALIGPHLIYTDAGSVSGISISGDTIDLLSTASKAAFRSTLGIQVGTPASASAAGVAGEVRFDADYAYFCTAANTWKRVAIAAW